MPLGPADLERVNQRLLAFSQGEHMYKAEEDIAMEYADSRPPQGVHHDMEAFVGRSRPKRSRLSLLSCRGLRRPIIASATTCSIVLLAHAQRGTLCILLLTD